MSRKLLIAGPVFSGARDGGLYLALNDLAEELRRRGWDVETAIDGSGGGGRTADPAPFTHALHSPLARLKVWPLVSWCWQWFPVGLRRRISIAAMPRSFFQDASESLRTLEQRLTQNGPCDAFLLCVDGATPGATGLALERHPRVLLLSMGALGDEFGASWWHAARGIARLRLGPKVHSHLFRPAAQERVSRAVFVSEAWRQHAVNAGLDEDRTALIYFGVPLAPHGAHSRESRGRILWVGRLTPAKGLHYLIEALPCIREQIPNATITAIAGPGPAAYRKEIEALVRRHHVEAFVTVREGVDRHVLQHCYAEHDVLFFHSENAEPVALTLLEAFASGIPVVATRPRAACDALQDRVTCLLASSQNASSLADRIITVLNDPARAETLSQAARELVEREFSSQRMGERFAALLDAL